MVMKYNIIHFSECVKAYGENCNDPCSENCINQTCDRLNGSCVYGCKDGENCDPGNLS